MHLGGMMMTQIQVCLNTRDGSLIPGNQQMRKMMKWDTILEPCPTSLGPKETIDKKPRTIKLKIQPNQNKKRNQAKWRCNQQIELQPTNKRRFNRSRGMEKHGGQ